MERISRVKQRSWVSIQKLEFVDEIIDVGAYFICFFLVDEVRCAFHHYHFFQKWYVLVESAAVNVLLRTWRIVHHIQIPHYEFRRNFDLCSSPWPCQLPGSAINQQKHNIGFLALEK